MISCTGNFENDLIDSNSNNMDDFIEFLNITYKGETYENVPFSYDEMGEFLFLDDSFSIIYEKELLNNKEWSIKIEDSSHITFYKDLNSNLLSNGIEHLSPITENIPSVFFKETRSSYEFLAKLELFDDKYFKDRHYPWYLNDTTIYVSVSNLKNFNGFNDKTSSLIIENNLPNSPNYSFKLGNYTYPCSEIDAVFIGYDDKNFSDRTIVCLATAGTVKEHPYLPGFNDKLSSFEFFFARNGQYKERF